MIAVVLVEGVSVVVGVVVGVIVVIVVIVVAVWQAGRKGDGFPAFLPFLPLLSSFIRLSFMDPTVVDPISSMSPLCTGLSTDCPKRTAPAYKNPSPL